jgi:hypothetical protein
MGIRESAERFAEVMKDLVRDVEYLKFRVAELERHARMLPRETWEEEDQQ